MTAERGAVRRTPATEELRTFARDVRSVLEILKRLLPVQRWSGGYAARADADYYRKPDLDAKLAEALASVETLVARGDFRAAKALIGRAWTAKAYRRNKYIQDGTELYPLRQAADYLSLAEHLIIEHELKLRRRDGGPFKGALDALQRLGDVFT